MTEQPAIKPGKRPELGEWLPVKAIAVKRRIDANSHGSHSIHAVQWVSKPIEGELMMYIGLRFVYEGIYRAYADYGDDGGYVREFQRAKTHEVWKFVHSERADPVYVFPQDVKWGYEVHGDDESMITDADIIAFRDRLIVARDEVKARLEYNRATDSTHDDCDEWIADHDMQCYQRAIDALNNLLDAADVH